MTVESSIEFNRVTFRHTVGAAILDDFSLVIKSGETLALVGRSGMGKTTILKLINRLLLPQSGEVLVEGRATTDWDSIQLRRRIGYVMQEVGLFPHMTIARNVAVVPRLETWAEDRIRERVDELLNLVGLDPTKFRHRYPRELSGGQRQRVAIGRAIIRDPKVFLFDEPLSNLDARLREDMQIELTEIQRQIGITTVLVSRVHAPDSDDTTDQERSREAAEADSRSDRVDSKEQ